MLWVPPQADIIRGVLIAGQTLAEGDVVRDPLIRKACLEQQIAKLYMTCGINAGKPIQLLEQLAKQTGFDELAYTGILPFGHSANGNPALNLGERHRDRCIGTIQFCGGMPTSDTQLHPGTPALALMGEFDEYLGTQRKEDGYETWNRAHDNYFSTFRKTNLPISERSSLNQEQATLPDHEKMLNLFQCG